MTPKNDRSEPPIGPPGWELVSLLSSGEGGEVWRVRSGSRQGVLRLVSGARAEQLRLELDLIGSIDLDGIAKVLEHGPLGAGWYLVREWVEGQPLDRWARAREGSEIGAAVARVARRLVQLHSAGFVHGDLKPENVLVGPAGEVFLTDFGLSRRVRDQAGPSGAGTLYALAPELLQGERATIATDVFALGVLLHGLLAADRAGARDFYARFPRQSYLEAAETPVEGLPPWSRGWIAAATARHPEDRPGDAREAARSLEVGLGLPIGSQEPPSLTPPVTLGREPSIDAIVRAMEDADRRALAVSVPSGESIAELVAAVRLRATLSGVATRGVELDESTRFGPAEVDRWAREAARTAGDHWTVLGLPTGSRVERRAAGVLARALLQARGGARLAVLASAPLPSEDFDWRVVPIEMLGADPLHAFLRERIEEESSERLRRFAERLVRAAGGSASRIGALLEGEVQRGTLLPGARLWRLRAGALPELVDESLTRALPDPDGEQGLLYGLIALSGGAAPWSFIVDAAGIGPRAASLIATLRVEGLVEVEPGRVRALRSLPTSWARPDRRRELHAMRAAAWERSGAVGVESWIDRWGAADADGHLELWEEFRELCDDLRDSGASDHLLERIATLRSVIPGERLPEELPIEASLCWSAMGEVGRAEAELSPMERAVLDDRAAARVELARARIAEVRNDRDAAIDALERARDHDPTIEFEVEFGLAASEHAAGCDAEVVERVEGLIAAGGPSRARWRTWCDLDRLRALSLMRLGRADEARAVLEQLLDQAERARDTAAMGTLTMNLATLERRAGDPERALRGMARAAALLRSTGRLAAEAAARAQLGGVLREAGRLSEAEPELSSALTVRERLGDRSGASNLRAAFALLLADRGHAVAATLELERAIDALEGAARRLHAPLLTARCDLQRARLGRPSETGEPDFEQAVVDPRTFLDLARAAALRGRPEQATELIARGRDLAARLGQHPVVAEAHGLEAALAGRVSEVPEAASGLQRADVELLNALARDDLEALRRAAESAAASGRDDRAARAWLALARRERAADARRAARARADDHLARAARGATDQERVYLEHALLSIPDPFPSDLEQPLEEAGDQEFEMEVLELLEINRRLVERSDLGALLREIVVSACKVTGAERGYLVLEEDGELRLDAAVDSAHGDVAAEEVALSTSVLKDALAEERTLNVSNAVDDPLLGHAPSVLQHDLRSILCAPFRATDDLRGVVVVDHRLRTGAFGPRAEQLLGLLAGQAAIAIRQVRRREEIEALNARLAERVAHQERDLRAARRALEERGLSAPGGGMVGTSRAMERVRALIAKAAPSGLAVLIRGESGTGKELAARALHELSSRVEQPFVTENVSAIPASLIESELFGYERGAFTGAEKSHPGLFERADGGTLFLDEIGEMPIELQAKLLRVLETRRVRRLGGGREREVDFRLLTATHRDLEAAIEQGGFRQDLYYRIAGLEVRLPSLAERVDDIPELVEHFLTLETARTGVTRRITPAVLDRLCRRPWPGNVRELANEVARLSVLSDGDLDDPSLVRAGTDVPLVEPAAGDGSVPTLAELERRAILRALEVAGGDKREAAEMLGISRAKVYQRLKEWRAED